MATLATPTELKASYPEFASLSDLVVQAQLDTADEQINEDAWGSRAKRAEMLLACHLLIVSGALGSGTGGGAGGGPIQSARVGDVSVTYASTNALAVQLQGLDPGLAQSRYGVEYARLVRLAAMGGAVLDGC